MNLRPLGYEDSVTPYTPCAATGDPGRILRRNRSSLRAAVKAGLARIGYRRLGCSGPRNGSPARTCLLGEDVVKRYLRCAALCLVAGFLGRGRPQRPPT